MNTRFCRHTRRFELCAHRCIAFEVRSATTLPLENCLVADALNNPDDGGAVVRVAAFL